MNIINDFLPYLHLCPFVFVFLTGACILILRMIYGNQLAMVSYAITLAVGFILSIISLLFDQNIEKDYIYGESLLNPGSFDKCILFIMLFVTILITMSSYKYLEKKKIKAPEFYSLLSWATLGAMLMVASKNLLIIFLGVEVLSISLYVLTSITDYDAKSSEAGFKYLIMGGLMSAVLLYGVSFTYGFTGTFQLDTVKHILVQEQYNIYGIKIGLIFLLTGLLFKSSVFPFHFWLPDVYQGAPMVITSYLSTVSKTAAMSAVYKLLITFMTLKDVWLWPFVFMIIFTMVLGSCMAFVQKDVKRMLAYSSMVNGGYMLTGILSYVMNVQNIDQSTMLIFIAIYNLGSVGLYNVLSTLVKEKSEDLPYEQLHHLKQFSKLGWFTMVIVMFSFIGIPPLGGFVGKFLILSDAIDSSLMPLVIAMIISSAISTIYYLKVVGHISAENQSATISNKVRSEKTVGYYFVNVVSISAIVIAPFVLKYFLNITGK